MKLVDEAARRLAKADLQTNYWVEAGAGTGKTTLLISRLLNIVLAGEAGLDQVAAITFTEKAAAELKVRLREALEERLPGAEKGQKELIIRALEEIETAPITTIHSFAAGILRERPVEAGVDPAFTIISGELDDLLEQAWEQWLAGQLAQKAAPLQRALFLGCTLDQLKGLCLTLYRQRDLVLAGTCPRPPDLLPAFLIDFKQYSSELESLLGHCCDPSDRGYQLICSLLASGRELGQAGERLIQENIILNRFPRVAVRGNKKHWHPADSCARQKEICASLAEQLERTRQSIAGNLIADLVEWARGFFAAVEKAKGGSLDFQDLLLKARDLLRDSLEVRRHFQKRFRYILVDEFQDTDPLQVELVFFLAEKSPRAATWREVEPVPGKLFLVGDPKQSIYRFRRADIEIYQEAGNILIGQGKKLEITQNFRTLPALIRWVNRCFAGLIEAQENYQPAYIPLHPYRPDPGEPSLIVIKPAEDFTAASAAAVRSAEAAAVAQWIAQNVGSRMISGEGSERRPLRYCDLAILFPTYTGIEVYEEALRSRGIPYRLEGGKRFYLREEIAALKNLLATVDNPYDAVSLVAVLRYWGGISDAELYAYKQSGGVLDYRAEADPRFPRIAELFALLKEAHEARHSSPVSALVERLLRRTWYAQRCLALPHGDQVQANLRKAIAIIRQWERERPLTLPAFARWLARVEEQGREESESLVMDPDGDAVQLLTIHKAKGLEFPAVCLVNLCGDRSGREYFLADRIQQRFFVRLSRDLSGAGFAEALEREKKRQEAEDRRLLYVAATRARDYLILPHYYNGRCSGFWKDLKALEEQLPGLWAEAEESHAAVTAALSSPEGAAAGEAAVSPDPVAEALQKRSAWQSALQQTIVKAAVPGPYRSAGSLAARVEMAAAEPALPDFDEGTMDPYRHDFEAGGAALGSAFHAVMEELAPGPAEPQLIERCARKSAAYWGLKSSDELARLVRQTLEHPLLQRARRSDLVRRELPFMLNLDGILVEGIIDLIFREKGGLILVDYKTDAVTGAELESRFAHYLSQGQVYALALAEITGEPVREASFLFVRTQTVKQIVELDPARLKESLRALIREGNAQGDGSLKLS